MPLAVMLLLGAANNWDEFLLEHSSWDHAPFFVRNAGYFIVIILAPIASGMFTARYASLPANCFSRYSPLLLPLIFWALLSIPLLHIIEIHPLLLLPAAFLLLLYLLFLIGFAFTARRKQRSLQIKKGLLQLGVCLGAAFLAAGLNIWQIRSNILPAVNPAIESIGHGIIIDTYMPFAANNKLAVPDNPPSLRLTENHPRLDGAIALLPVYGAAAQAVYAGLSTQDYEKYLDNPSPKPPHIKDLVECNNTPEAWAGLLGGHTDIFFGVTPSSEQLQAALAGGLDPEIIPIGKDAFVFMVNIHNPVDSLTVEQIRDIYRKKITNWKDVDGENEKIMAFQRPEGSGSQTAMTEQVMGGLELADPLREEYMIGMGDIINAVAEFRNRRESIGYTFRWYSQVQFPSDQIKLLAINGVSPLPENIANDTYPFTVPLVAVTVRPRSPETQALIDWLLGPEGQALIRKTGYVPLHPD